MQTKALEAQIIKKWTSYLSLNNNQAGFSGGVGLNNGLFYELIKATCFFTIRSINVNERYQVERTGRCNCILRIQIVLYEIGNAFLRSSR